MLLGFRVLGFRVGEYGMLRRDCIGILFPYSLLTPSKTTFTHMSSGLEFAILNTGMSRCTLGPES